MKLRVLAATPALQIVAVGILVFALEGIVNRHNPFQISPAGKPVIEMPGQATGYAPQVFLGDEAPSAGNDARNWLEQEVLYREGRRLGLDRGDTIVRRRLIQKMEWLVAAKTTGAMPTESDLRAFYRQHQDRYLEPTRLSFALVSIVNRAKAEQDAIHLLLQLRRMKAGPANAALYGDPFLDGNRFSGLTATEISRRFGDEFLKAIEPVEPGSWSGPIRSRYGLHLVYIEGTETARISPFAQVQDRLARDWTLERRRAIRDSALADMLAQYKVIPASGTHEGR